METPAAHEPAREPAARPEAGGRHAHDDWHDVVAGLGGAAIMAAAFLTPFHRAARSHWGVSGATASRPLPGDDLIADPRWMWTHGTVVEAPAAEVWPWVAQIGADRAGFYSYQFLENIPGCGVDNADEVHPGWEVAEGDDLVLHPDMPPMTVEHVERGRCFLAHAAPPPGTDRARDHWAEVTWLFYVDPLDDHRCEVLSRYRCATSDDLATRLELGPALIEPVGFAMDRRMLLGIKERAEARSTV